MGPSIHLLFLHAKQGILDQNYKSLRVPDLTCRLCIQNSTICTRTICLCGSQTSPVVLCVKNSVPSIRNTSLYVLLPSSVILACKTACFGPELQVSMVTRPSLSFCACKTVWLASELLVSMGPSPHLWFLDAKSRLLEQNNKSLWVPDMTCRFVHANQRE